MRNWLIFLLFSFIASGATKANPQDPNGASAAPPEHSRALSADNNGEPENAQAAPDKSGSLLYGSIALAGLSALTLLIALPAVCRIRHEHHFKKKHPQSWDEIGEVVHETLNRFGKKVYGRCHLSAKPKYSLLKCSCGRQWMITTRKNEIVGRNAWLITVNHNCTHFEVHHNARRTHAIRSDNLTAESLFDALTEARRHGPFRLTHTPHGQWHDSSAR